MELPYPLQVHYPPSTLMCSAPWELPESPSRVFRTQSPAPFSSLKMESGAENLHPFCPGLAFLVTSPTLKLSRGPPLSHLISINSGVVEKGALLLLNKKRRSYCSGNSRGFISSVLGTGDKTKYYFVFYRGPQRIFL